MFKLFKPLEDRHPHYRYLRFPVSDDFPGRAATMAMYLGDTTGLDLEKATAQQVEAVFTNVG